MNTSRLIISGVAVLIILAGTAPATEAGEKLASKLKPIPEVQTVFVVIAPLPQSEDPHARKPKCVISPDPRIVPRSINHMTVLNLTDEPMTVEVSKEIADTDLVSVKKTLKKRDQYLPVKLRDLPPGEYLFTISGPDGGCLPSELPNPKIVIP